MKNILLIVLVLIGLAMIFLGISSHIIPPSLTGIGFILIAILLYKKE